MILVYVAAFLLAACYNVLWTQYSIATGNRHAAQAACWAASISLVTSIQVMIYMHSTSALIPQVIGAGVGAYCGIYCRCRKEASKRDKTGLRAVIVSDAAGA